VPRPKPKRAKAVRVPAKVSGTNPLDGVIVMAPVRHFPWNGGAHGSTPGSGNPAADPTEPPW